MLIGKNTCTTVVSSLFLVAISLFGFSEHILAQQEALNTVKIANPLPIAVGDPYVLYHNQDSSYYMYGTGGDVKDGFGVFQSKDLSSWVFKGQVYFGNNEDSWGTHSFWAPEVYEFQDKFYLFYSAHWKENPRDELENFRIGVAVSDSPLGPFKDLSDRPLFDPGYPIIDANVFADTDGKLYLYYSRCCYKHSVQSEIADWAKKERLFDEIEESWVYGIELKPDFSGVVGDPVLLLRPPMHMNDKQAEWESRSVTSGEVNRRWTEGSVTFKHGSTYYMMYSANHFGGEHYAVGYATAEHPLGPFVKASNNPVIEQNIKVGGDVSGTGHNSIIFSPTDSKMYCVYHGRTKQTGNDRVVFIDEMEIREDGTLIVHGPTTAK
ncbi:family 43 glycosylhydrolase [Olivibacter sp. SDN3]|uniref:glycoside hydrolase family 43 protein n=1 Tax=Olivibacter sp. SDN3 TaxID=2764720 RepID=UPI00165199AF|nr:glycoside hydrolase family 43 protein [Olivibacter sp. SDN3]QNL50194.1 family 43 glycosylhydrolase [Olivibacter sp. SDN3]